MLNTNNRKLLTQGIDSSELRRKIDHLVMNMAVILTIINSDRKVKVDAFKEFCRATYLHVTSIHWIELTPSSHAVLGQSAELIEENGNRGLEANNKIPTSRNIEPGRTAIGPIMTEDEQKHIGKTMLQ